MSCSSVLPSLPLPLLASLTNFSSSFWISRAPVLTSLPTSLRSADSASWAESSDLLRRFSAAGSLEVGRVRERVRLDARFGAAFFFAGGIEPLLVASVDRCAQPIALGATALKLLTNDSQRSTGPGGSRTGSY